MSSFSNTATRIRSDLWYVLPIFGGIIGGLISWFAIRYDDPRKARNCFRLGIVLTAIPIILMAMLAIFGIPESSPTRLIDPFNPPIVWTD